MTKITAWFDDNDAFLAAFDGEVSAGGLLVRGASMPGAGAGDPVDVEVIVAGETIATIASAVAAVASVGIAVTFTGDAGALEAHATRLRTAPSDGQVPEVAEESPHAPVQGTAASRLAALSMGQKISLALSCDRETRLALIRDTNKTLHAYVFRNPRIGLDEVQWAAKMTTISPDALKVISEHKEWGANPTVVASVVRNPKTPIPIAIRLLPRVPAGELKAIAKGGARDQIVQAARKLTAGGR